MIYIVRILVVAGMMVSAARATAAVMNGADWKSTLPVAGPKGDALEMLNPGFSACLQQECTFPDGLNKFFYRTSEGLVFRTECTGVTTSSETDYSRTELREMNGSTEANWTLADSRSLEARLKISALEGGTDKIIFMQIHGKAPESQPLLKCVWERGSIRLLTKTGAKLKDLSRRQRSAHIGIGEWFTCSIKANQNALTIQINGETVESYGRDGLDSWPAENTCHFKVGNYLQDSTPGAAAVVVYSSIIKK